MTKQDISYMTVDEYLESEEVAKVRREYVDGQVFAMTGSTDAHNVICSNVFTTLHAHLRGTGCRAYSNDMKVRIDSSNCFYYPDIMVTCEPFSAKTVFKKTPVLIVEILSRSTKHIDRREKMVAYRQIASLKEYLVICQDRKRVEMHKQDNSGQWTMILAQGNDVLQLDSLQPPLELPLTSIYEGLGLSNIVHEEEAEYNCDSDN